MPLNWTAQAHRRCTGQKNISDSAHVITDDDLSKMYEELWACVWQKRQSNVDLFCGSCLPCFDQIEASYNVEVSTAKHWIGQSFANSDEGKDYFFRQLNDEPAALDTWITQVLPKLGIKTKSGKIPTWNDIPERWRGKN
mmetsp:Transcript_2345/g.2459  ORF Transcript_2345/g.2459 Transcript_2345/m.2459 type:complete len:139 (+) Transcript_2345:231-647(+)